jgi:phosphatidylethanolamine/phosphatidyl-N-methylethanolamine N-methyltransferase
MGSRAACRVGMRGLMIDSAGGTAESETSEFMAETTKMSPAEFAAEALADFLTVGAIAPSSPRLTKAMLEPLSLESARIAVELGPGSGVMTRAMLRLLPRDATLLAFEIKPRFIRYLKTTISDPRLTVIDARAEALQTELRRRGYAQADAILSSLALGFLTERQINELLGAISVSLSPTGIFTQYHYVHGLRLSERRLSKLHLWQTLRRYFRSVERKTVWANLPPAFVFACREPIGGAGRAQNDGEPERVS